MTTESRLIKASEESRKIGTTEKPQNLLLSHLDSGRIELSKHNRRAGIMGCWEPLSLDESRPLSENKAIERRIKQSRIKQSRPLSENVVASRLRQSKK